jgi:ribose-phosphate pyrophosphokinase
MIVLPMPGSERFAQMGHDLGGATGLVQVHRFPDGEGRVRITGALGGEDVVLVAGLDRPDEKVVPLLFAAATARDLGAASVGLVAPYLPYLRQDRRFRGGEGVSARYFCRLLSSEFDWVVGCSYVGLPVPLAASHFLYLMKNNCCENRFNN